MSDLDDLMDRDPLSLSSKDIDEIIRRQREHRARVESGVKVKKDLGPTRKIDLLEIGLKPKVAPSEVKRRF